MIEPHEPSGPHGQHAGPFSDQVMTLHPKKGWIPAKPIGRFYYWRPSRLLRLFRRTGK